VKTQVAASLTALASCFLRKVSRVIGKSFLAISTFVLKEIVHSLAEHFQILVNKINNLHINYLKTPKKHLGPHKMPSRTTRGPRAAYMRPLL